jgi:hypothetical protein
VKRNFSLTEITEKDAGQLLIIRLAALQKYKPSIRVSSADE